MGYGVTRRQYRLRLDVFGRQHMQFFNGNTSFTFGTGYIDGSIKRDQDRRRIGGMGNGTDGVMSEYRMELVFATHGETAVAALAETMKLAPVIPAAWFLTEIAAEVP